MKRLLFSFGFVPCVGRLKTAIVGLCSRCASRVLCVRVRFVRSWNFGEMKKNLLFDLFELLTDSSRSQPRRRNSSRRATDWHKFKFNGKRFHARMASTPSRWHKQLFWAIKKWSEQIVSQKHRIFISELTTIMNKFTLWTYSSRTNNIIISESFGRHYQ